MNSKNASRESTKLTAPVYWEQISILLFRLVIANA